MNQDIFTLDKLSNLETIKERIEYCNSSLKRIGEGTSRIVYSLSEDKVLKLAKNGKGIMQNKVESNEELQICGIFPKLYEHDKDGMWEIMEKAEKANISDIEKTCGLPFDMLKQFIYYIQEQYLKNIMRHPLKNNREIFKKIEKDENFEMSFLGGLKRYLHITKLKFPFDLYSTNNWGVIKKNGEKKTVIIDFGLLS